ncbi:MAG: DUF1844 domain-containing protein [candidate division Zixibacteria bacterium]|nr:DUF1844 domain-containing protein [candidate division Zixibacteria bacterium]
MTDDTPPEFNPLLMQLIISLQSATMMELGKLMNPQTQKAERRLPMAKNSIDMLTMLQQKMAGNLTADEEQYLSHVLYELRMNYVEESEKPDPKPDDESTPEAEPKSDSNAKSRDSGGGEKQTESS